MHSNKKGFLCICKKKLNNSDIVIKRKIEYNNKLKEIIIEDDISSTIQVTGCFNFVLSPNIIIKSKSKELELNIANSKIKFSLYSSYKLNNGWYSERYGEKKVTKKIVINKDADKNKYIWKIKLL
jgi:hypothetical protein